MTRNRWKPLAVTGLGLLLAGCTAHRSPPVLARIDIESGYRFLPPPGPENSEKLFVVLSFSGGGTRAAAFSYGALAKLKDTTIEVDGERRRLLDEVDLISSVSGGSFTAAYYGLFNDRLFEDFEGRFLKRKVQRALILRFLAPWNWPRLLTPGYDRIDLAADYYDRHVFDHRKFEALAARQRTPLVVINATDMSRTSRFEFTQDQFDLLCSDLAGYPIARAVAASSAFPFLLSPLTIEAHPRACGYREPLWLADAREERRRGSRRFYNAQLVDAYRDPHIRFIHLLDGGLADNIGLRGPLQLLSSTDSPRSASAIPDDPNDKDRTINQKINREKIDTILVIAVNARTRSRERLGDSPNGPKLVKVFGSVANGPLGNYSYETVELLKESVRQWTTDVQQVRDCRDLFDENCREGELPDEGSLPEVAYYAVELNFQSIEDQAKRERLQGLPTSFQLMPAQVDEVVHTAGELLDGNPRFQDFLSDFRPRP